MARLSYKPGDFDLLVKRSKTGLGLYAGEAIPKNACVIEYTGVEITKEQEEKSRSRYLFEINTRKTIDGAPRWNTARYINHSCRPNCEPNIHKGRVYIHAKRAIKPGEELAYNYGKAYFDEFLKEICGCPKCQPEAATPVRAAAARQSAKKITKKTATKSKKSR